MFGVMDYGAFVVAVIVFLAIPGPGNLALVTSTGKGGMVGGLAATLGVIAGDQVLIWLAVAGMAALLSTSPVLFAAVQWLGAAYLAWLGWKMITAKPGDKIKFTARLFSVRPCSSPGSFLETPVTRMRCVLPMRFSMRWARKISVNFRLMVRSFNSKVWRASCWVMVEAP